MDDDLSDLHAANAAASVGAAAQQDDLSDLHAANQAAKRPGSSVAEERNAMGPVLSNVDTVGRGLARTFPFMDDVAAAGDTAASYLPENVKGYIPGINPSDQSGKSFGERYSENLARQRAINKADDTDRPVPSYGAQVAGAFAVPLGGAAAATRIADTAAVALPRVVSRAVGAGTVGATYGAAYGAGQGTSLEDRANRAGEGALFGGVTGAALPVFARTLGEKPLATLAGTAGTGAAAGSIYGAATGENQEDSWQRAKAGATLGAVGGASLPILTTAVGALGNKALSLGRATMQPEAEAERRVADAFRRDADTGKLGMSSEDIAAANASNQPLVAADVGGETVRSLARSSANTSPEARAALAEPIAGEGSRFETQGNRFSDYLKGLFGTDLNSASLRSDMIARARNANAPAYGAAYAKGANGIWDDDLAHMMQSPDMQDAVKTAMRKAQTDAVNNRQTVVKNPFSTDEAGNIVLAKGPNGETATPSLQFWDQVKRSLDDKIGVARRSGANDDARMLGDLKSNLTAKLDDAVPEYASARMGAYKYFQADNALEAGGNFLGMSKAAKIDEMKASLAKMNPAEKQFFAQGLASEIAQKATNASERRNIVGLFNSPETRDKMQLGLGADKSNQIEAYLRRESMMDMLRTGVFGNSTTIRQKAEEGMAGHGGLAAMVGNAAVNPIAGAAAGAGYAYHEHGVDPYELGKGAVAGAFMGALGQHVKGANQVTARKVGEMLASEDPIMIRKAVNMAAKNPQVMDSLRRSEMALTQVAAQQRGQLNDVPSLSHEAPPLSVPVPMRADGGRVQPSEAQKEAGNYKKDHLSFQGLQIAVENAKDSTRSGTDHKGKPWKVRMRADYGYIKRTEGADGDHVDCYLGPNRESDKVFIIDQRDERTQKFDEHKVMLGFSSRAQALHIYREGFSDGKGGRRLGGVTEMSVGEFKDWLKSADLSKPSAAVHRAMGGRIGDPAKRASHLEKQASRIAKAYGGELEPLLRVPDHIVAHALRTT